MLHERYPHLYVIGLTGNIGCGKSAVTQILSELGAAVCDADQVTRQVMEIGQAAYTAIVAEFGPEVLSSPDGPLDRPALGRIVFSDPAKLRRLEALVHPPTRAVIFGWLADLDQQAAAQGKRLVAVVDAIKLIESGWPSVCDAVWVVYCDPAVQLQRLIKLRGLSEIDARQRIAAQPPQVEKIAVADVVIDNSGSLAETRQQVVAAMDR